MMRSANTESRKVFMGIALLFIALWFIACTNRGKMPEVNNLSGIEVVNPEWSKNANIYEVNIRQFTEEGTLIAFQNHLPRLKEMGVDILWLMPIHPIGEKNRKGTLGSYYSVRDYKAVNPEFGTMEEFIDFVQTAHGMGFKVILDWVANHTAWDHPWITEKPEFYTRDSLGNMISPYDWSDVADLNYDIPEVWDAMLDALKFWVEEAGIDGYRCDVAGMVPTEFWERVRSELDMIKPVFMLAEAEQVDHHYRAFDMSYAWELHHLFNRIARGEKDANDLASYFERHDTTYPAAAYRMIFIDNHDENSWNGTVEERLGDASDLFAMLCYTLPGMPLIYSGQETGLDKRLEFFEKDVIEWDLDSPLIGFYTQLSELKHDNMALWNGRFGGTMTRINTTNDTKIFAFVRERSDSKVLVIANLSDEPAEEITLSGNLHHGKYINHFSGEHTDITENTVFNPGSWSYQVFVR
ncbi:MAG: alpha-amylase family glycosyl hydrolase [Bacteroidales bacterium]